MQSFMPWGILFLFSLKFENSEYLKPNTFPHHIAMHFSCPIFDLDTILLIFQGQGFQILESF